MGKPHFLSKIAALSVFAAGATFGVPFESTASPFVLEKIKDEEIVSQSPSNTKKYLRFLVIDRETGDSIPNVDYELWFGEIKKSGVSGGDGIIKLDTSNTPETGEITLTVKKQGYETLNRYTFYFEGDDYFIEVFLSRGVSMSSACDGQVPVTPVELVSKRIREGESFVVNFENACPNRTLVGVYGRDAGSYHSSYFREVVLEPKGALRFKGLWSGEYQVRSYFEFSKGNWTKTGAANFEVTPPH